VFARFRSEMVNGECALCNEPAVTGPPTIGVGRDYICRRCGAYSISQEFAWEIPTESSSLFESRYKISWSFRQASENFEDLRRLPMHARSEITGLLNAPDPSVEEKLTFLLLWLGKSSKAPGKYTFFDCENDFTLLCARDRDESHFLLEALQENGLVTYEETMSTNPTCRLTASGWAEIQRLKRSGSDSNSAFIAMSFSQSRQHIEQAISGAITESGYRSIRMDRVEHVNRIDDEIISQLRRAKFLIADFTDQNNGVYFESGFMLGLGRPVLWVCDKADLENVHFDMRQYNTIDYDGAADLQTRLHYRIEAVIGRGSVV
jgi:hypothetical protein